MSISREENEARAQRCGMARAMPLLSVRMRFQGNTASHDRASLKAESAQFLPRRLAEFLKGIDSYPPFDQVM
jgi:hypothetical protein